MSTRRTARVASMIREVVSNAILFELRDPRIKNVTVLGAQVSPDLRHAAVRISVMGDEKTAALSMHGLTSARGYLQSKVAEYIKSRYTPELRFVLDDSILKSIQTSAIDLHETSRIVPIVPKREAGFLPSRESEARTDDSRGVKAANGGRRVVARVDRRNVR